MSDQILIMRGICKDYKMAGETLHVLKNIDLSVKRGQFLAILGPSGSGKSTLMNIIGCLDVPTSGEYELSGRVIADEDEASLANIRNKEIGFILGAILPRFMALLPIAFGEGAGQALERLL